jgi:hypothetical protein
MGPPVTAVPPGGVIIPRVHIGCGGTVLWDLSGGFCTRCHAEGLEPDDAERASDVMTTRTRADRFYREPAGTSDEEPS